jgi:hypothetical protein
MTPKHNQYGQNQHGNDRDRDDPILDACLSEVLGGQTPPDLSDRILAAFLAQSGATPADAHSAEALPAETLPAEAQPERGPRVVPEPLVPATLASGNGHVPPASAPQPLHTTTLRTEAPPSLSEQLRQRNRRMQWMALAAGLREQSSWTKW